MVSKVLGRKTEKNPRTNKPNKQKPNIPSKSKPLIISTTNLGFPAFCEPYPLCVTANLHQINLLAESLERIFLSTLNVQTSNCTESEAQGIN